MTFAFRTDPLLRNPNGNSGALERDSITKKPARAIIERLNGKKVKSEMKPYVAAFVSA